MDPDTPTALDDVALVPLYLGMLHMECPECQGLSDTVNIGVAVHECHDCPPDLYGVVQYEQCKCVYHCTHLAPPVAKLLDRVESGDVELADDEEVEPS
jgi:hypothetical protein